MTKTERYHCLHLRHAVLLSSMSYAEKRSVGCVIVAHGNTISEGWNGMPPGYDNACEIDGEPEHPLITRPEVLHAEENAIGKVAASTQSALGATMYLTYAPCVRCARLIWRAGITHVYYLHNYEGADPLHKCGLTLLRNVHVHVEQLRLDGSSVAPAPCNALNAQLQDDIADQ